MITYLDVDGQKFATESPSVADTLALVEQLNAAGHVAVIVPPPEDRREVVDLDQIRVPKPRAGVSLLASMAGIASAFGGRIPLPALRQKPPRPADPAKLAAAEAKRQRRAKRRLGVSDV